MPIAYTTQLQMFTEPKTPTGPQHRAILNYLRAGNSLTVGEALEKLGIYALSQRCGDLRKMGYPIKSELIKTESGKHISKYSLDIHNEF